MRHVHVTLEDSEAEAMESVKGDKTWKDVLILGGVAMREEAEHGRD